MSPSPGAPAPFPRPLAYATALRLLEGYLGKNAGDIAVVENRGHQFALAGGGSRPRPDGTVESMSYLRCMFQHWSRY